MFNSVFGRTRGWETLHGAQDWYNVSLNGGSTASSGAGCRTIPAIRPSPTQSPVVGLGSTGVASNLPRCSLKPVDMQPIGVDRTTNNDAVALTFLADTPASVFDRSRVAEQLRWLPGSRNLGVFDRVLQANPRGAVNPLLSEPSSLSMLGIGLLCVAVVIKRRIADSPALPT